MEIIGIGNIVCDIYYKDKSPFAINGGQTWANIIFNLANMDIKTKVIGNVGNDELGNIALDSLNRVGVDISNIKKLNQKTNRFHISIDKRAVITKKKCPICNKSTWEDTLIDIKINSTKNIIIIDRLKYLNKLKRQLVMLNLDFPQELMNINREKLESFLSFPIEILKTNERIVSYLIHRLNLSSLKELYERLNVKLLLITRGKREVTYLFKEEQIDFKLLRVEEEIDPNGAGDMFFASTIRDYLDNNLHFNKEFITNSFKRASELSGKVVKLLGARTYFQEMYEPKEIEKNCLCD